STVVVSATPHVRRKRTTRGIMLDVLIALLPATVAGLVFFGARAAVTIVLSVFGAVATEWVWLLCKRKSLKEIARQFDLTSVITGLLLALTLPPLDYKYAYIPILSSIFAVGVAKMLFGGTGRNIVNPAIAGRVFAFISFQSPMVSGWMTPAFGSVSGATVSSATPLTAMLGDSIGAMGASQLDLFLGTGVMGCIGETCKIALLVGFLYLVVRRVIKWQWPVIYIVVTGLISCAMGKSMAYFVPSILSGGLFLGAIFMATDYVTSPNNKWACYVYYVLLGVVTALLRFGTKIEVVSFAILLLNLIVPLLNMWIRPRPFGATPIPQLIKDKCQEIKGKLQANKQAGAEKKQKSSDKEGAAE
ncbi:MAG: RnfABCDGE type electron transport complex subunit D, partial [Clostridia bacterium]|nr:RnfABCDGE type electron transport complex subunit D [Clostridia bacterium]